MRNTNAVTPQISTFGLANNSEEETVHTRSAGVEIFRSAGVDMNTHLMRIMWENNIPCPPHTHTKSELKMRKALSDLINARHALSLCKFKVGKLSWPGLYKDVRVQHNVRSWKTPAEQEVTWQEAASRSCRCNCPLSRSLPHLCSGQTQKLLPSHKHTDTKRV